MSAPMSAPMSAIWRWRVLDVARGLAVVAMVVFHLIWDLAHFGYIAANVPWSAPVKAFGHSIAFAFLFIAGAALALAHRDRVHWPAFWRRIGVIAGAAALVSAGTYLVFPTAFVFFGILHCIGAASVIAAPFLFAPWGVTLAAAVLFLAAPEFLASPLFNADWLQWVGLGTREPLTNDWRPIFPWAGALLLGVAAGRLPLPVYGEREVRGEGILPEGTTQKDSADFRAAPKPQAPHPNPLPKSGERGWLVFLGRHSLLIYLAHQPLLFALFSGVALIAPPKQDTATFVRTCEARCVADGGVKAVCHNVCVCTADQARRDKALAAAQDDAARARRLNEMARTCMERKEP